MAPQKQQRLLEECEPQDGALGALRHKRSEHDVSRRCELREIELCGRQEHERRVEAGGVVVVGRHRRELVHDPAAQLTKRHERHCGQLLAECRQSSVSPVELLDLEVRDRDDLGESAEGRRAVGDGGGAELERWREE
eukprot:1392143-Pleurochrysis_carterae.AAC.2